MRPISWEHKIHTSSINKIDLVSNHNYKLTIRALL